MSGADNRAEGRSAIQRDLEKLERWAYVNLVKFNKADRKGFCLDQGNPMCADWEENSLIVVLWQGTWNLMILEFPPSNPHHSMTVRLSRAATPTAVISSLKKIILNNLDCHMT